jgi:hypothetical protein
VLEELSLVTTDIVQAFLLRLLRKVRLVAGRLLQGRQAGAGRC